MGKNKKQRGQATIELLIIITLIFAVLYGAADYWMTMVRIQQAEHVKNFYLDRARIEGCLKDSSQAEIREKMDRLGLKVTNISVPTMPVKRSLNDYPIIELKIETEFKNNPFMLGFFLGEDNKFKPEFYGKVFSEYVETPMVPEEP